MDERARKREHTRDLRGAFGRSSELTVIAAEENSTRVICSLEQFLKLSVQGILNVSFARAEELVAMAYLSIDPGTGISPDAILRKSYGMYRLYPATSEEVSNAVTEYLGKLRTSFVETELAPDWLPLVTYRTGLDYGTVLQIWRAMERAGQVGPQNALSGAINAVLDVLSVAPPILTSRVLVTPFKTETLRVLYPDPAAGPNDANWSPNSDWTGAWNKIAAAILQFANGEHLQASAQHYLGRSDGAKPLPRLISFTRTDISNVAQVAGAMAAIFEARGQIDPNAQSAPMIAPLAIKYGCGTLESLSWYRFAIRLRKPAHVLGRLFGVPAGASDTGTRSFVNDTFREFLDGAPLPADLNAQDAALIQSVRTIVARA